MCEPPICFPFSPSSNPQTTLAPPDSRVDRYEVPFVSPAPLFFLKNAIVFFLPFYSQPSSLTRLPICSCESFFSFHFIPSLRIAIVDSSYEVLTATWLFLLYPFDSFTFRSREHPTTRVQHPPRPVFSLSSFPRNPMIFLCAPRSQKNTSDDFSFLRIVLHLLFPSGKFRLPIFVRLLMLPPDLWWPFGRVLWDRIAPQMPPSYSFTGHWGICVILAHFPHCRHVFSYLYAVNVYLFLSRSNAPLPTVDL